MVAGSVGSRYHALCSRKYFCWGKARECEWVGVERRREKKENSIRTRVSENLDRYTDGWTASQTARQRARERKKERGGRERDGSGPDSSQRRRPKR